DYVQGAMLEPLAVGLQAASEGEIEPRQSVAILGSWPTALSSLQASLVCAATSIIVVVMGDKRLHLAKQLVGAHVSNAKNVSAVEEIVRLTGGLGADVVLETAGAVPTIKQSLYAARRGGTVVLVGIASQAEIPLDVVRIV